MSTGITAGAPLPVTPPFAEFANQWFLESEIQWRRSYRIRRRGALDKYLNTARY
jgi:hypothetical protein